MRGIVFLDRDGTLIEEVGYLSDPALLKEIPGAAEGLLRLSAAGYLLAVLSNQAGLAKGKFGEAQFDAVRRAFESHFRDRGVAFDAIEYCPHHPEGTVEALRKACGCRKPETGMAETVLARLAVPPECPRFVVGDKMIDVVLGKRLGAATILVGTGYGAQERERGAASGEAPDVFLPGIREAAEWILRAGPRSGSAPDPGRTGSEGKTAGPFRRPERRTSMDPELLEILACPKCKGELALTTDETELRCGVCLLSYRIDDGIPILLVDEAHPYE